jgi:hypothetical protein
MSTALSPKVGSLSNPTNVGNIADVRDSFLAPPGATFHVYVFCVVTGKTQSIGPTQEPINILHMGNVLQLQILPGGVSGSPKTRLRIQTQNNPNNFEYIPLKDFPQQKWVQLAIVREGRRFTVYYNGEVIGSQRTLNYPVINSSQLKLGDTRLRGEFVRPIITPTPMRIEEIQNDLRDSSDTREVPYKPTTFGDIFTKLGCPSGLFCFSTSKAPSNNPLKMWQSPY